MAYGPLTGRTILIVEDEPLTALDVHAALRVTGASIISAMDAREAEQLARNADISAAILDVGLGGFDCAATCRALTRRAIPFGFYTGHRAAPVLRAWPHAPVLRKPASNDQVVRCVIGLLGLA